MRRSALIILLTFLGLQAVQAQKYPFRAYSIENGLSESVVNAIVQDEEGFIWLGTGYGLNKFNGYEFRNYYQDSGLNDNKVFALYRDSSNRIWIGTGRGVNYLADDSVYSDPALDALSNQLINTIFEDSNGDIWFGTDGGGVWMLGNEDRLIQYTSNNGLAGDRVRAITQDRNNVIWFASREGLSSLNNGDFRTYTMEDGLPENRLRALYYDELNNRLWIGSREGIAIYNPDDESFRLIQQKDGLVNNRVTSLRMDHHGKIWAGTEEGLTSIEMKDDRFTLMNYTTQNGLANNLIHDLYFDAAGNLWLGTLGGGVNLFTGNYFENYAVEEGLSNNLVTALQEDRHNHMWIATYGGGLMRFDGDNFRLYDSDDGLADSRVYVLTRFRNDEIWMGSRSGIALVRNDRVISLYEDEFPFRKIRGILETSDGSIWYSTYGDGAVLFDGEKYTQFTETDGLGSNTVMEAVEDPEGNIWFATYGGVTKYDGTNFETLRIEDGLPNNGVIHAIAAQDSAIWFSTFGGVARLKNGEFEVITDQDGLPNTVSYFVFQSSNGLFWIGTNDGVVRLDYEAFKKGDRRNLDGIRVIRKEEGLIGNELNAAAIYEDRRGRLWMGTVDGLSIFYPERFSKKPTEPQVYITGIRSSGREFDQASELSFSHNRSFIEVDFVGLDYAAPEQITYEYRIKGIDPDWQTTRDRSAKYPSLPAGDYKFEVRARNADGLWSEGRASVSFRINAPFWQQWWFIGLNVIIIGAIIFLLYDYWRVSKMVDIERIRVRIASDLHDDVGASLTEIALQSDFLQATNIDNEIKKSLQQIGRQSRHIVNTLDDIVWSIDARNDTLGDLTDRMQDYINQVLESKNMRVNYNFDDLDMDHKLPVELKENLYLIFKEAANNIAKYSNGDKVDIELKSDNSTFRFLIRDNGSSKNGIKKTGHGLRNMEMRANRVGAKFNITNSDGFTIVVEGEINPKNMRA
jgi:ligand-binding sensor domain-containing protein/two-component sensor histidine kinase